jgi:site-specific DNA recombinase
MSESDSTIPAVAYWRMSSSPQEKSIPQQQAEMRPKAKLADVEIVREFEDRAISGGGMAKRDAFLEMVAYCEGQHREGNPVAAVVCYDTARFSRATSIKTARYIDQLMDAGVFRLFTWERWFDFRKEEDRAIFNLQQDFTNNRYLREHSRRVSRGRAASYALNHFNGGSVPYAFDRMLLDEKGKPFQRVRRGQTTRVKGAAVVLVPSEDHQELEVVRWLFRQFAYSDTSFRALAMELNKKGIPGPGTHGRPGGRWRSAAVKFILKNPHYAGDYRYGYRGMGAYHRIAGDEVQAVDAGAGVRFNAEAPVNRDAHDAIVDRATWDLVQKKIKDRTVRRANRRSGGFVLGGGITYCGHCGAKMMGDCRHNVGKNGPVEYRYLNCQGAQNAPGTCRDYSIREDKLLPFLVRKLEEVYLNPKRLEGLRAALKERVEAKHAANPERADRLRQRLRDLDGSIATGRRRALQVKDDATFVELNEGLRELVEQRRLLHGQLEAAEREQGIPAEDMARMVDAAIARLYTLRESLQDANRDRLRAVIRQLVSRIDLFWEEAAPGPRRAWFRFAKGIIKLRPHLEFAGNETHQLRCRPAEPLDGFNSPQRTGAASARSVVNYLPSGPGCGAGALGPKSGDDEQSAKTGGNRETAPQAGLESKNREGIRSSRG